MATGTLFFMLTGCGTARICRMVSFLRRRHCEEAFPLGRLVSAGWGSGRIDVVIGVRNSSPKSGNFYGLVNKQRCTENRFIPGSHFWFLHHETDPITSWIPQLAMDPFQGRGRECPWWLEGWDVVKWWVILEWWKYASCVGGQGWGCNDYDCMTMNMTMTNDCLYHYDYGYEILLLTFKPYQLLVLARGQRRRMWGWIVQCWQGLVVSFSFRGSKQKRINIMERELKTINLSIYIMYCVTYCIYIYI